MNEKREGTKEIKKKGLRVSGPACRELSYHPVLTRSKKI